MWALYQQLTDGKPLKDADRDDGRKLVAHFEGEGLKSATILKKLMWRLAARLGITVQQVQKYEKGTNRVSAARLFAIASILRMPITYFL